MKTLSLALLSLMVGSTTSLAAAGDTLPPSSEQTYIRALRLQADVDVAAGNGQRRFILGVENSAAPGTADYRSYLLYVDGNVWKTQRCIAASSCVEQSLSVMAETGGRRVVLEATTMGLKLEVRGKHRTPWQEALRFDLGADNPELVLRPLTGKSLQENPLLPAGLQVPDTEARVEVLQWSKTGPSVRQRSLQHRQQQKQQQQAVPEIPESPSGFILKRDESGILGYDADGVPFFDKGNARYHAYDVESSCSKTLMPGCNFANARAGSLRYPVPGASGVPVVDEQVAYAAPVGFVRIEVYGEGADIINVTLPFHVLHPGIVRRWLEETPDSITLYSHGEGTGPMPHTNELLSGLLWTRVDERVFEYMRAHP